MFIIDIMQLLRWTLIHSLSILKSRIRKIKRLQKMVIGGQISIYRNWFDLVSGVVVIDFSLAAHEQNAETLACLWKKSSDFLWIHLEPWAILTSN